MENNSESKMPQGAPQQSAQPDWYSHPDYIGKTKGRVGGGCCSVGCAVVFAVVAILVVIGAIAAFLAH